MDRPDGMTPRHPRAGHHAGMEVSIRVARAMSKEVAASFPDMHVTSETVIDGQLPDHAALHGVLARLRHLGLPVVDIQIAP